MSNLKKNPAVIRVAAPVAKAEEPVTVPDLMTPFDAERYLRDFSHLTGAELGTLLGTIVGQIEYALSQPSSDRESAMRLALKAAERATVLSRNLRYFASESSHEVRPTDLSQLLLDTVELVERDMAAQSIYPSVSAENLCFAVIDESAVRQALLNLIAYAVPTMNQGSRLVINLRQTDKKLEITLNDTGGKVFAVDLTRPLDNLFHEVPKNVGEDSLLGLIVAKTLLEAQGGSLHLSSSARGGTTIHAIVPRFQQPAPRLPFKEKRRTRRIRVRLPVEVKLPNGTVFTTELTTLGKLGCFLVIPDPKILEKLPVSTRISIRVTYFQKEFCDIPQARVVNHVPHMGHGGVGVEFEDVSNKARKVLGGILKSHAS